MAHDETLHDAHPDHPHTVDLRSDTVTQPTPEMRRAMADAMVGDALLGDDPTVARLEESAAARFGKEAAMFVPSGTMGNLAAIIAQTGGRVEVLSHRKAHIFNYESGGLATLGGCQAWPIETETGIFDAATLEAHLRPDFFVLPKQGLVSLENTVNDHGGRIWPQATIDAVAELAHDRGLGVHMDGARVFHAQVATGTPVDRIARDADTLMFCVSKGLSAPVGSLVVGDAETIERAVHVRKQLGGAMRQAGHLAAAAQIAVDTMVDRLAEDHATAQALARELHEAGYGIDPAHVESNILVFDVRPAGWSAAAALCNDLQPQGVKAMPFGPHHVRFVTHRHIATEKAQRAVDLLDGLVAR